MARSRHPGVKLFARRRKHVVTHYGRVEQTDGSTKDVNLDEAGLLTEADRLTWAQQQSELVLAARRARALSPTPSGLRAAAERFLADAATELRPNTVRNYTLDTERLVSWLEGQRVDLPALSPEVLFSYRAHLRASGLAPNTLSSSLKNAATALGWWRRAGLVPLLTRDTIKDNLRPPSVPAPDPVVYTPDQLRALLSAALPRWEDAAPVALALLLGLRLEELVRLDWSRVCPAELPTAIRLQPEDTKTKRARTLDLSVTPGAGRVLQALRERQRAPRVIPWLRTQSAAKWIMRRLRRAPGVPGDVTWKGLRSTAGTFLACSNVWPSSPHYRTARQLGHSVSTSERYYLGLVQVEPTARTLEEAMGVAELVEAIAAS